MCKILTISVFKVILVECISCTSKQILQEIALFSGKIYTAGTNFTRPSVAMVVTNLNSGYNFCRHHQFLRHKIHLQLTSIMFSDALSRTLPAHAANVSQPLDACANKYSSQSVKLEKKYELITLEAVLPKQPRQRHPSHRAL